VPSSTAWHSLRAPPNGVSLVVDPYGHIQAESDVDVREVIAGDVFVAPDSSLYTRFGDWFGWTTVVGLLALSGIGWRHDAPRT
jgi:apolipoprotein N-acyltransferase